MKVTLRTSESEASFSDTFVCHLPLSRWVAHTHVASLDNFLFVCCPLGLFVIKLRYILVQQDLKTTTTETQQTNKNP